MLCVRYCCKDSTNCECCLAQRGKQHKGFCQGTETSFLCFGHFFTRIGLFTYSAHQQLKAKELLFGIDFVSPVNQSGSVSELQIPLIKPLILQQQAADSRPRSVLVLILLGLHPAWVSSRGAPTAGQKWQLNRIWACPWRAGHILPDFFCTDDTHQE